MPRKESPQINIYADPALRQHNRDVIKSVGDNHMRESKNSSFTIDKKTIKSRNINLKKHI